MGGGLQTRNTDVALEIVGRYYAEKGNLTARAINARLVWLSEPGFGESRPQGGWRNHEKASLIELGHADLGSA